MYTRRQSDAKPTKKTIFTMLRWCRVDTIALHAIIASPNRVRIHATCIKRKQMKLFGKHTNNLLSHNILQKYIQVRIII